MPDDRDNGDYARLLGWVGIIAAALMLAADLVIMDSSSSGAQFGHIGLTRLAEAPNWRLTVGGTMGPIAAFLFVFGFCHVYLGLSAGSRIAALVCCSALACGYVTLGAWHAAGPMFAFVMRLSPEANPMSLESWTYMSTLGMIGAIPIAFGLVLLPMLILALPTRYPKWFAMVNPGLIYWMGNLAFQHVPGPIGGYLVMGSGSISFLVFFVVSTIALKPTGSSSG